MTNIFQIDWISVDIIIIILLFLFLLVVRMFKTIHRWRYAFSNQALEHICFSQSCKNKKNKIILTKKWCLTRNLSLKKNSSNHPLILILRKNYKTKLLRALTEGLGTYGFNVITIKAKIKNPLNNKILEKTLIEEWKLLISTLLDDFEIQDAAKNPKYILINHSKSTVAYRQILSDPDIKGVILINPKLNKKILSYYKYILSHCSTNAQILLVFSRKSIFIFKNKHLKSFLKDIELQKKNRLNYLTIEKATYSFKYYETILLGMIIDIIENKFLKSEI